MTDRPSEDLWLPRVTFPGRDEPDESRRRIRVQAVT
jgi:hypothetical protein